MQADHSSDACTCVLCTGGLVHHLAYSISSGRIRSPGLREVYAPVSGSNPQLERAIREVSDAEIRGAFLGRDEALHNGG